MSKQIQPFTLAGTFLLVILALLGGSALLVSAANAAVVQYPAWSFKPTGSNLPAGVQFDSLHDIGEQGEMVMKYHTTDSAVIRYGVIHNGVLTPLLGIGDPAPGGGIFVNVGSPVAYAASPTLVYITTYVNDGGQDVQRTFRSNQGALSHLPTQANEVFDLSINDAHGKFISKRVLNEKDSEFQITDGITFSAPIALHFDNNNDNPQTRQTLIGITVDGAFLVHESIVSGIGACGGYATFQMRLFWLGSRSGNVVTGSGAANGCGGSGTNINPPVMNSAGDILSWEYSYILAPDGTPQTLLSTLRLYPGSGEAASVVAQGEQVGNVGPYWGIEPKAITEWRQPIFMARGGLPTASERLFSGPDPSTDAFGGDFLTGFGQDGIAQNLYHFSEKGYAQVLALLADGSSNYAIGSASPSISQWVNPAGGSWSDANNWSTGRVPGATDEVLFGLGSVYTVDYGSRNAGRIRFEDGNVTFNGADLRLLGPLSVSGDAVFELLSGKLDSGELVVGALPPADPGNPPFAEVRILNQGTALTGTTVIKVGDAAPGKLFVQDAEINGGPLLIGNAYPGSAILSGAQAQWFMTGATAVGYNDVGTLNIESGAYMRTDGEVVIGRGTVLKNLAAIVEVNNLNAPPPALGFGNWLILNMLTLGDFLPGELYISHSGQVSVSGANALLQAGLRAHPEPGFDAILSVDGSGDTAATPAMLAVDNDVLLGMASGASVDANINYGGILEIYSADLYLGFAPGSEANMTVAGINNHTKPALLRVTRPAPLDFSRGVCAIGESGVGRLLIHSGGQVECSTIRIGGQPDASGLVVVNGANGGSTLTADGGLCIGGDLTGLCGGVESGPLGTLELKNSASVSAGRGTIVGPGGQITGSGDLTTGVLGLYVAAGGVLDPGVTVLTPTGLGPAMASSAAIETGVLQINGAMTLTNAAQVKFDILGPQHFDHLLVSETLQLNGGTLVLAFGNGYAPQQGDTFQLLQAGSVTGDFSTVQITGLEPGFDYALDFSGGQVRLTALNNGVQASNFIFMPLVVKGP